MYPDEQILMEVGRIAVAAGRLDADLGMRWWQLARDDVDQLKARKASAGQVREKIKEFAANRLETAYRNEVVAFAGVVEAIQKDRNAVMHSQWLLRDSDAMRPADEFLALSEEQRRAYIEQWEREARAFDGWRRQANDSLELGEPYLLEELVAIERRLADASHVAQRWNFQIASMRVSGHPSGWLGRLT
ncbi:hypothetical protein OG474_38600 [Kribbella sp. NBC_01505]|uniref:hypothetical protein n=1 Tax=Kribbella sp. NBC_01505 TaxID=2903580 RepID=UPI00386D221F